MSQDQTNHFCSAVHSPTHIPTLEFAHCLSFGDFASFTYLIKALGRELVTSSHRELEGREREREHWMDRDPREFSGEFPLGWGIF